jgi:uncharacterized protein YuzE
VRISYDGDADCLYITFSPERASYLEITGGILRVDEYSKQVLGVTIPFFREKTAEGNGLEIPEIGAVPFTTLTEKTIQQARRSKDSYLGDGR